jgi:hypothetical protein
VQRPGGFQADGLSILPLAVIQVTMREHWPGLQSLING